MAFGILPELWAVLWKTIGPLGIRGGFHGNSWGFPESLLTTRTNAASMPLSKREQRFRGSDLVRKAKADRAGEHPGAVA